MERDDAYLLDMLQEADDCGNVVRWISLLGHEVTRHLLGAMGGEREPGLTQLWQTPDPQPVPVI